MKVVVASMDKAFMDNTSTTVVLWNVWSICVAYE